MNPLDVNPPSDVDGAQERASQVALVASVRLVLRIEAPVADEVGKEDDDAGSKELRVVRTSSSGGTIHLT